MMPNFPTVPFAPPQNPTHVRHLPTPPQSGAPASSHDVVQEALDRYDYAALPQATQFELGRVASLPNGGAQMAQGLRDAAASGDVNALRSWLPALHGLLQQQGQPPHLAAAYAVMGVRAAALQATFGLLTSMEAHWQGREGNLVAAEQASTAAWEYASLARIAPFVENSPVFAAVRGARQPVYQPVYQPVALPVFDRATGYADASTQTDKPKSIFLNDEALDALTPISLDTGASASQAGSASPMTYVWPEQMAGPEQYLLDPLSPELTAVRLQTPQFSRPPSPLLLDDAFSFFPITQPASPRLTPVPTRAGTPNSMLDAPSSPHPSVGRSPSPQPAEQQQSIASATPNAASEVSTPVAKRTRSRPKQLIVKLPVGARLASLQSKARVHKERPATTSSGKPYACAGGCGDAQCNKSYRRLEHRKRHQKLVKDIACLFQGCQSLFSRRDNMQQHLRIHFPTNALDVPEA